MRRFLATIMSFVIGATSVWAGAIPVMAAEDADVFQESGDEGEDVYDNILGDDPVNKTDYHVTFTVETNGEQFSRTYKLGSAEKTGTASPTEADGTADTLQTASNTQVGTLKDYKFYDELLKAVDEFMNKDPEARIVGWTVYTDGHNTPESDAMVGSRYSSSSDTIGYVNRDLYTFGYDDWDWDDEAGEYR